MLDERSARRDQQRQMPLRVDYMPVTTKSAQL